MESTDPKFQDLLKLLEDYSDVLWQDKQLRETLCYFIGRFIQDGIDINDQELSDFEICFRIKLEKYCKEKAN